MTPKLSLFFSIIALMTAALASAHHMWLEIEPGKMQGQIFIADDPAKERVPMKVKPGKQTTMQRWNVGELSASKDGKSLLAEILKPAAAAQFTYGIHGPDLITWYAKGCATVTDAEKPLGLDYEFTAKRIGTNLVFHLVAKKKPVANCRVEVFGDGIPFDKFWKTDAKGNLTVSFPKGGRIYVAAEIKVDSIGKHKDQDYKGRLEMPCLTFLVPRH